MLIVRPMLVDVDLLPLLGVSCGVFDLLVCFWLTLRFVDRSCGRCSCWLIEITVIALAAERSEIGGCDEPGRLLLL